jgi:hypothetical protein
MTVTMLPQQPGAVGKGSDQSECRRAAAGWIEVPKFGAHLMTVWFGLRGADVRVPAIQVTEDV